MTYPEVSANNLPPAVLPTQPRRLRIPVPLPPPRHPPPPLPRDNPGLPTPPPPQQPPPPPQQPPNRRPLLINWIRKNYAFNNNNKPIRISWWM